MAVYSRSLRGRHLVKSLRSCVSYFWRSSRRTVSLLIATLATCTSPRGVRLAARRAGGDNRRASVSMSSAIEQGRREWAGLSDRTWRVAGLSACLSTTCWASPGHADETERRVTKQALSRLHHREMRGVEKGWSCFSRSTRDNSADRAGAARRGGAARSDLPGGRPEVMVPSFLATGHLRGGRLRDLDSASC
jgi:hypothetical protein